MRRLLALLLLALLAGCTGGPKPTGKPVSKEELKTLESEMLSVFAALEMYAHDHSLSYPDDATALVPKYIDSIPNDPVGGQPLRYEKTERGYLIKASGDYSAEGAAEGFPRMDNDGVFGLKAEDFTSEVLPEATGSPNP